MPGRGPAARPPPAPAPAIPDEDYNFEEANKHFDKEKAIQEAAQAVKATPNSYNKDDFFDMIGCESLEKLSIEAGERRMGRSMHEQRMTDIETGRATCRRTRAWEFEAFEGGSWLYNGADGHICLTSYGRV